MNQAEIDWVREAFASGSAAKLRLTSGHTIFDCGAAAGISGEAWWKFENGESITGHRAPMLAEVLRRMRNGERLEAAAGATPASAAPVVESPVIKTVPRERLDASTSATPVSPPPVLDQTLAAGTRRELALLVEAESFMDLSFTDLIAAAPTWESVIVREMRIAARRALRKRIDELSGKPPAE